MNSIDISKFQALRPKRLSTPATMSLEVKLEARPTQYQDTVMKWPAAIVRHQKYAAKSSITPSIQTQCWLRKEIIWLKSRYYGPSGGEPGKVLRMLGRANRMPTQPSGIPGASAFFFSR